MSQPKWKFLANLGDTHPLTYGGWFVYEDETGVYPPEAEVVVLDDETEDPHYTVYRFVLEPHTFVNGVLSDNPSHPDHPVWYAAKDPGHKERHGYDGWTNFCRMAEAIGKTPEEFAAMFCSPDPRVRAMAYREVAEYHGYDELDQYPLKMRKRELRKRYLEKNGVEYS
jgi:hypothetical protein